MGFVRSTVCILILVAVGCGQQAPSPDDAPAPSSKLATSPSSLTSAPIPSPSPTPILTPPPTFAPYWRTVERNGEIEGYGYALHNVKLQAEGSDLIARVRHVSVEPSFRINPGADPEHRYSPYIHFSFSIIELLRGTPAGDVVVVEYSVAGLKTTKAQAIEEAKKWIASERDAWWNKRDAIIFLDDLRFERWGKISELSTGAHYSFADHFSCGDHDSCYSWHIGGNDSYPSWVWLPSVGQYASLEVPDSERMFRVAVVPYGAIDYELQISPASLANIKAILEPHWSKAHVRADDFARHRLLWEVKGSDSYSYVYSGVDEEGHPLFPTQRIVVRNGEAVEAFYTEDNEEGGVVYPAGTRIEPKKNPQIIDIPTLEDTIWHFAEQWPREPSVRDVSFDYEFGYPTAIRWGDSFLYASEYTPLEN